MISKTKISMLSKKSFNDCKNSLLKYLGGALVTIKGIWITNGYWCIFSYGDYSSYKDVIKVKLSEDYPLDELKKIFSYHSDSKIDVKIKEEDLSQSKVLVNNFYFKSDYIKLALKLFSKKVKPLYIEIYDKCLLKYINKDAIMIIISDGVNNG